MNTQFKDKHTPKTARVSSHPLTFEDALRGLLGTKPTEKKQHAQGKNGTSQGRISIRLSEGV